MNPTLLDGALTELGRNVSKRAMTFMEVCGTHTVSIFRSGLRSLLPKNLRLLSGPGCPVCVTDQSEIDMALNLVDRGHIIATYGDMLRVPGSGGSLMERKGKGGHVEILTSAFGALELAEAYPGSEIVFLGVGFETTAPATAVLLKEAFKRKALNLSVLCFHKTVPAVMRKLCSNPALAVDGFILPGNVTTVMGIEDYSFLSQDLKKASVAAGFEPEEILAGLVDLSRQVTANDFRTSIYRLKDVPAKGNPAVRRTLDEVFEPCEASWRGLGSVADSGLRIRENYASWDARKRFEISPLPVGETACRCGEVLSGTITPPDCQLFGSACTPLSPVGPCMVSGEGTCGIWYRYR